MKNLKILITGGAGFIGSNIADEYIRLGHKVTIIDNLSAGNIENINPDCNFYKISLGGKRLEEVFRKEKFDVVNHHAAQINLRTSVMNPVYDAETNIIDTLRLLELSVKYGIRKFIFASSGGAVYGEQLKYPAVETHESNPMSPYGISKLTVENYLKFFGKQHGLDNIILRYSNVYGPRQNFAGESGVISIFLNNIISGDSPKINGNGNHTRDFVFVKDVVNANVLALNHKGSDMFNVSTSKETSINSIVKLIIKISKTEIKIKHLPPIKGEQKRSILSYKKAERILGWKPQYDIEKGIEETLRWFLNK
ncbi:MAG: GDP-mannose 4,6-dehydratase [Bacteroidetes bacterium]|nr:GDP-mannose 4,6-dehydratase [Bacteroidota bacterium]